MPLFFMISGYCIGMKKDFADTKFIQELKKVFFRLILPYLVWSLLYIVISGKFDSAARYVATVTLRGIAPLWFLATLAMCELSFFAFSKLIRKHNTICKNIILAIVAIVSVIIGFVMQILKAELNLDADTMTRAGYYVFITFGRLFISLPPYILGYILKKSGFIYKAGKLISLIMGIVLICGVSVLVISLQLRNNCHLFYTNNYWMFTLVALLGAIGVMMLSYSAERIHLILGYLGQNSLGLMILHYIPFKTVKYSYNAVSPIWNNEIFISIAATIVATSATLGVIYLVKKKFFLYK